MHAEPDQPIQIHPENPHYFTFRGKSTVLITSAEHYGAVVNLDFDYVRYLDRLAAHRLNYTRIYPGALIEKEGDFRREHAGAAQRTLDPPLGPQLDARLSAGREQIRPRPLG
jgi:hypothetical protein